MTRRVDTLLGAIQYELLRKKVKNINLMLLLLKVKKHLFWMMFFDQNNFLRIAENYRELRVMQQQKSMLMKKIVLDSLHTEELLTDDKNLEKFAREQYLMKKPNEDVFVIIEK